MPVGNVFAGVLCSIGGYRSFHRIFDRAGLQCRLQPGGDHRTSSVHQRQTVGCEDLESFPPRLGVVPW